MVAYQLSTNRSELYLNLTRGRSKREFLIPRAEELPSERRRGRNGKDAIDHSASGADDQRMPRRRGQSGAGGFAACEVTRRSASLKEKTIFWR
jgi:hypothetical protein